MKCVAVCTGGQLRAVIGEGEEGLTGRKRPRLRRAKLILEPELVSPARHLLGAGLGDHLALGGICPLTNNNTRTYAQRLPRVNRSCRRARARSRAAGLRQ